MIIEDLSLPAAVKYNYYAPNVSKVLTTTGRKDSPMEYRNSELVSYKMLNKTIENETTLNSTIEMVV